jgi:hypothetical protein
MEDKLLVRRVEPEAGRQHRRRVCRDHWQTAPARLTEAIDCRYTYKTLAPSCQPRPLVHLPGKLLLIELVRAERLRE